jgi:fructose-specific component phosphotransferase system IIB-like protein
MAEDSTMDWVTTPYDYMGTTNGGNGTVLARSASDANVFFVRWDPWVEFYNGAGDYAAGYRTLIGNGNDHAYATAGGPWNYYNFTDEAKQVYLKEVARMVELPEPPEKPRGLGKEIVFVSKSSVVDDTGEQADKVFIDDLEAEKYVVITVYSTALETASQGLIDTLNNADLVIIGRSGGSSDFGNPHKDAWNAITSPVMNIHPWTARNSRLNWLPTGTTTSYDTGGDTISAKIELPDDPVFADATMAADSTMDWVSTPYDYMETTNGGNGTVLVRDASSSNVFFVRWDPWVEFYNGAGDYAAGYRTLIGNGNDHAYASAGGTWNYYNFTDEAKEVYLKEVARMTELPEPPEKPRGLDKEIVFVSKSSVLDDTGEQADKPFIDDLLAEKYEVITVYSTALETASQGFIDTLNNADLVIIGRSGGSSDFGDPHKDAWNAITSPVMNIHPWTARNSRLNWLPTGTTTSYDTGGDTISAKIELPDDPVFADATMAEDSTMDWVYTPYDYMETTNGGNGTVLARDASSSNVFFVRWDPWVEFYDGADDYAAGYRTLIGNGNDHAYATAGGPWNYYNFTDEAKEVYLKEVARMIELPEPPEKPAELSGTLVELVNPSFEEPGTETKDWTAIPGWNLDQAAQNSGVSPNGLATDGSCAAWLRSDDGELWNLTDYTIQAGDVFALKADVRNSWQATSFDLRLYYDDNGTRVTVATTTGTFTGDSEPALSEYTVRFVANTVEAAIGKTLGISIHNTTSEADKYIEMDNFRLYRDNPTGIADKHNIIDKFVLYQNYPNPFNPQTSIKFSLVKAGRTTLKIYNTLGQLVATLVDKKMQAGVYTVSFNAASLSSGMYLYRIESGDFIQVKKMLLLK